MNIVQKEYEIVKNAQINENYYYLQISARDIASQIVPGQFVSLRVHGRSLLIRRPFSVYDTDGSRLSIIYKVVGKGTSALTTAQAGESIDVMGPLGNSFEIKDGAQAILVGGGVGIAPLYLLAKKIGKNVTVLLGAQNKDELVCQDAFSGIGCDVRIATDDGSIGEKGLVTELLKNELAEGSDGKVIYTCGPKGMLKAVSEIAKDSDVLCQVSLEEYMACGIGACMGCVVKVVSDEAPDGYEYQRVCKEGPVFEASTIIWE